MKIVNLKQVPEFLETLARWHQAEWSHLNPGQTLNDRIIKMQAYLNDDIIPSTYVAVGDTLLGSAALVASDMDDRPELTPWLASVYVAPAFRCHGVGTKLVQHVMQQAKASGIQKMYLYTPDQQAFYQRLGWHVLEERKYHDCDVVIMYAEL